MCRSRQTVRAHGHFTEASESREVLFSVEGAQTFRMSVRGQGRGWGQVRPWDMCMGGCVQRAHFMLASGFGQYCYRDFVFMG